MVKESILIGRETECMVIKELMARKKDIMILGEEGVGKSAIINKLLSERDRENFLYSSQSKTLKEALISLIEFRAGSKKNIQNKTTLTLKKIGYEILDQHTGYVVFDHISWIEPRFYGFLIYIMNKKLPLIILARGMEKTNIGQLWRASYTFEKVEITTLDKSRADELIRHYITSLCLKVIEESEFNRKVFNFSKGNPKIIKQLCFLTRDEKYHAKGYPDVKLMDLDRRISQATN